MPCQKHKELLERWWNDRLTEAERAELEAKLSGCEDCRRELEGSRELWDLMGHMPVPEPSGEMQVQFNSMLESFKTSAEGQTKNTRTVSLFGHRPWAAAAVSAGLLIGGFGLGLLVNRPKQQIVQVAAPEKRIIRQIDTVYQVAAKPPKQTPNVTESIAAKAVASEPTAEPSAESKQLAALTGQMREMREMMMISLLQNPAASERIRAVSYTNEIGHVNPTIAAALLATLNNDANINVRLSTLEALTHFARDPSVREGLIQSILQQESPLVQAALADVMLKLQEKRAIQPFKKLLQQKDLNQMVRSKIEQTITQLT